MDQNKFDTVRQAAMFEAAQRDKPINYLAEECVVAFATIELLAGVIALLMGVSADTVMDEALIETYAATDAYR